MNFFAKLFGRKEEAAQGREQEVVTTDCPHAVLAPRWDSVQDIGHEDRAVGFRCTTCNAMLSLEEAAEIRRRRLLTT